ncbi:MAG: glycosyltransferase [Dehalococcoidia bacterium]
MIIDNHSNPSAVEMLGKASRYTGAHLVLNRENLGVAVALNQGIATASEKQFRWVLTLDQDTVVAPNLVANLVAEYSRANTKQNVAVIGSNYWMGSSRRTELPFNRVRVETIERPYVITAGSLFSLAAVAEVGPFRDRLFIDYVDVEFCFRARSRGFLVLCLVSPFMWQPIGNTVTKSFLGRRMSSSHHSAERRYSMTRNFIVVTRGYWRREPAWVLAELLHWTRSLIGLILLEDQRSQKLSRMLSGVRDGLTSRI